MFDNKVEDFERICERVGNVRDEAVAQGARIVHRTKQVRPLPRNMENYMRTSSMLTQILCREEQR